MKKIIVTTVIIASACGVFGTKEILAETTTRHTVQKGDTLWDLSGEYLDDPLFWPKIWKLNPGISNPDLILPGQIVRIPGMKKAPAPQACPPSVPSVAAPMNSGISPLDRAGLASTAEPLPIVVLKKNQAPAVDQAVAGQTEASAEYYDQGIGMLTNDIPSEGVVLRNEQGWQGTATGDTILISAPGAQVGQRFGVYRDMGKIKALSYFAKSPGHLLADIAIVEVVSSDAGHQEAVIRRAFTDVRTDDVLGQIPERPMVSESSAKAGAPTAKGSVVAFHLMRQFAGPDDIVYLNIGAEQGLAPGDLLAVTGTDQAEGRNSGEIMVLRVSANTAAAVVTKRSSHEVHRGDVVGPSVM